MESVPRGWILFFVILSAVVFSPVLVSAAIHPASSELGVNIGLLRGDDFGTIVISFADDPATPEDESEILPFETSVQDELFLGFRYTYNFTSRLGAELGLSLIPNASVEASDLGELFEMDIRLFNVNAVFHILEGRFIPFVTAGIGFADFSSEVIDSATFIDETDFAFNFGGGLKLFLTDTFVLRGDIRNYSTKPEDLDRLNLLEVSGGVAFIF